MKKYMPGLILGLSLAAVLQGAAHAATSAFDTQHRWWRVALKQGQVQVDHSQPLLTASDTPQFSAAVAVTPKADAAGELQPAIAVDDGKVWVAWSAQQAVYVAVSNDQGATFSAARKVADSGVACGGIALQTTPDHQVAALWRQAFDGGARDYAIAKLDMQAPIQTHRATFGGRATDICPQPAPALARGGDWGWHMAWSGGGEKPEVFYARMDGDAWVSSPAKRFAAQAQASPSLLAIGEKVWLAWKQGDQQGATVNLATSDDGGRNWGDPVVAAKAEGESAEPMLLDHDGQAYLWWDTAGGRKFLPLP